MRNLILFLILLTTVYYSCQRENLVDNSPHLKLSFSTDTVVFDTIFSGIGSATKYLKVYNPSSKDIEISEIYLAKAEDSKYRLNIDGKNSSSDQNVLIKGKDSLFLFVDVTINTDQDALLEQDSIIFITNGNQQDIKLISWGQAVNLINEEVIQTTNWTKDKPYLIYNSMLVDSAHTLTIEAGTKIHFHRGSKMFVAGTLNILGTYEEPVILEGDRLEHMYFDVPGQWEGIWLMNGSKHNYINFAEIKNAVTGIQVDTLADVNIPTLTIHNTKIEHMSFAGIYAQGTTIFGTNCQISDCGFYNLALTIGGWYEFYHCTFANYWRNSFRNTPLLLMNNYYIYEGQAIIRDIVHAGFYNCLIYGDRENELYIDSIPGYGVLNYSFENCLIKYNSPTVSEANILTSIINEDPLFIDPEAYNFALDTLSPAKDKALRLFVDQYPGLLNYDLNNESRTADDNPDIGAYERIE